jgi:hypothetical protein
MLCGLLYLNMQKKWVLQTEMDQLEPDSVILGIVAFCLWPLTLIVLAFLVACKYIKNHALPRN